jgi:hypothetical protein
MLEVSAPAYLDIEALEVSKLGGTIQHSLPLGSATATKKTKK